MSFNRETGMYEGYIYLINNLINNHKYIGQTLQTINKRWTQHKVDSKKFDYPLYRAIRKYGSNNFSIIEIESFEDVDKYNLSQKLDEREIYWIDYYETFTDGYNQTIGGQNNAPNKFPEHPVNEYTLQGELLYTYKSVIDASDATGFSMSDISSCSSRVKINRVKNRIFRYVDDPLTEDEKNFYIKRYPKIRQYDFKGNLINEFDFIQDAVNFLGNNDIKVINGNILSCCKGKTLSAGGYVWRKAPDGFEKYRTPVIQRRIEKRDISDGHILEIFTDFDEIVQKYNYNRTSIDSCCIGRTCASYGFHWCYEGEFDKNKLKRIRFKPIKQFDLDGNMIKNFDSAYEAVKELDLNGTSASASILAVCNGKQNFAFGFVWRYMNDMFDKYKIKKSHFRFKINKYIDGIYIETFQNLKDAAKSVGIINTCGIRDCCDHLRESYKNATWYYQSDLTQPDKTKIIT